MNVNKTVTDCLKDAIKRAERKMNDNKGFYMSINDISRFLMVGKKKIRSIIKDNKIKPVDDYGWYYYLDEIQKYL